MRKSTMPYSGAAAWSSGAASRLTFKKNAYAQLSSQDPRQTFETATRADKPGRTRLRAGSLARWGRKRFGSVSRMHKLVALYPSRSIKVKSIAREIAQSAIFTPSRGHRCPGRYRPLHKQIFAISQPIKIG